MSESPEKGYRSSDRAKPTSLDRGELQANLDHWILWVKEHIHVSGDIPTVFDLIHTAAKDSSGRDLFIAAMPAMYVETLESWWGEILARSPADLALRMGILACARMKLASLEGKLKRNWSSNPDEEFLWAPDKANCERARETLALLVRFLPVEECNTTWRDFRWEILNSYLILDWNRATDFFNRAEALGLRSSGEIAVFRGQLKFLVVFGDEIEKSVREILKTDEIRLGLDSLFWNLEIYGSRGPEENDQVKAQLLFEHGMCDADRDLVLNASHKQLLLDAANDLQKAFLSLGDLPYPYRAMLARCHYCIGHFHDAAEQYNALSQSQGQSGQPRADRRLFASLSLSYRQAGETERAKQILQRWAREFPGEKGVYLQLAELEARGADYQAVVEYLRKEMDRNPAVDTDWKLSALLALGTTQDTSEAIKNELKDNSDLWNPICSMLSEYWRPFSKLSEKGREKWVFATVLATSSGLPERTRMNEAAVACVGAVEIELRDRVFRKYKEHVSERPSLIRAAEDGLRFPRSGRLCQFLVRDGDLTLGEMATILKMRARDDEPTLRDFQSWISRTPLRLMKHLDSLEGVVSFRNPAVHENRIELNPKQIIQSCRAIIEALN